MITLRPVEPSDVDVFYDHQADTGRGRRWRRSRRATAPRISNIGRSASWRIPDGIVRTIVVDGAVAGNVLSWLDPEMGRLLGYWIGREFWGQGVATAAVSAYLAEVRERPIQAFVAAHNIRFAARAREERLRPYFSGTRDSPRRDSGVPVPPRLIAAS